MMTEEKVTRFEEIVLDAVLLPESPLRVLTSKKKLAELVASVKEKGILVPILVVQLEEGYRVIAGLRRVLAARQAGLLRVPALIVQEDEEWQAWATFAENSLREEVNAFDEGRYITLLMATMKKSQAEIARLLGMSESWVSERLRIVEWPSDVREGLIHGRLGFSVGKELSRIADDGTRAMYVRQALTSGCSPAQALQWRQEWERELAARKSVSARGLLERTASAAGSGVTTCTLCEREAPAEKLRELFACERCVQAIEEGLRG